MIGIAFNMDYLRRDIFSFIAKGMDDDATAYRAVRAGAASFRGAVDL
jgi:hypothetical protein